MQLKVIHQLCFLLMVIGHYYLYTLSTNQNMSTIHGLTMAEGPYMIAVKVDGLMDSCLKGGSQRLLWNIYDDVMVKRS
jgi:hypothetical protein